MRSNLFRFSLLAVVLSIQLHAQTYTPKEIRFEGAKAYAPADLLAASGLKRGGTITMKDIQTALQKLADTGLFADTRYAVDSQALVLTLTPIDEKQTLPVRYGNLVWWPASEITPLVHARVPLFSGTVPNDGTLLDSVKQALIAMLAEKKVTATLDSMTSSDGPGKPITAITLTISSPTIKVGDIHFEGASAGNAAQLAEVRARVSGDDFDEITTAKSLINETEKAYRDNGYLDIAVDPPQHDALRADGAGFLVDLSENVHGGEVYHVGSAELRPAAPVSNGDLQKLLQIKAGDIASQIDLLTAQNRLASPYHQAGYLDAETHVDVAKDAATHRVGYTLTMVPGEQYHVVSVKPSGFTQEQQAEFDRSFHVAPNAVFDAGFFTQVGMLNQRHAFDGTRIGINMASDRKAHTVVVTLAVARAPGH